MRTISTHKSPTSRLLLCGTQGQSLGVVRLCSAQVAAEAIELKVEIALEDRALDLGSLVGHAAVLHLETSAGIVQLRGIITSALVAVSTSELGGKRTEQVRRFLERSAPLTCEVGLRAPLGLESPRR